MWIKKINEFFDNMSKYDNSSLSLHFKSRFNRNILKIELSLL